MIERDILEKIKPTLSKKEVVLFVGARQTGKTTLLNQIKKLLEKNHETVYSFTLEDPDVLLAFNTHPEKLFDYVAKKPDQLTFVLIDEIQYLKNPSNFLKYFFDVYQEQIKLIVTGSSAFYIDQKFLIHNKVLQFLIKHRKPEHIVVRLTHIFSVYLTINSGVRLAKSVTITD